MQFQGMKIIGVVIRQKNSKGVCELDFFDESGGIKNTRVEGIEFCVWEME